ncbi:hypothetical protein DID88_006106 [Monilinia fructigena]|uniref:Uncharacterized protein n=1 Tax=Monilinia fructigena TaxID=38457 RepID=A0A395J1P8_9HELO|nr:hypothetical protein DID88_006106 [Monilinia fructigena]
MQICSRRCKHTHLIVSTLPSVLVPNEISKSHGCGASHANSDTNNFIQGLEHLFCEHHTVQMEGHFQNSSVQILSATGLRKPKLFELVENQLMIDTAKTHNIGERDPIP